MHKNIIKFIVFIMILTSISPMVAEGVGYVKEIEVEYYDLYMAVEGKKIRSNKEPFIYNEEIWVPLTDLAKGLGLGYSLDADEKIIHLDSKGKLKGPEISKKTTSFQQGFQVEAKERIKKSLEDEIYRIEKGIERENIDLVEGNIKNLKVYFGDVKVYLDKKELDFSQEPIFYQDDIYVNIMDIGSHLYITPTLNTKNNRIDIDANGILINKDYYSNIDQLIAVKNGRDYWLDIEMENLEKRKKLFEELNIPYRRVSTIKALEDYLNRYMNGIGDLTFNIELKKSIGNWLDLTISFPSSRTSNWYRLTRREVEDHIWDIYSGILILYKDNALIEGRIRNPYYSRYSSSSYRDYVKFSTKGKDLTFDFYNSNLKKDLRIDPIHLVDTLNKNLNKSNNVEFKYAAKQNGYNMDLDISVNSKSFLNSHVYTIMSYLKKLNYEIRRIDPDLSVDGTIHFNGDYEKNIKFNIENNRIRSVDLLRETENYINSIYGSFSYGIYGFGLKYSIYEKSEDKLHLIVEGDFSTGDDKWIYAGNTGKVRLNSRVQGAINTIKGLWDMEIFTEVLDKDMIEIDMD